MAANEHEIETIFLEALEKESTADRQAYLSERCGDDSELRRKVDSLLDANAEMGDFMARTCLPSGVAAAGESTGSQIGPYRLVEQIGEGGMGVVFIAAQSEPVTREVALKIIKPGMDSREVLARFEMERQALAMMDHPNIARVLDAGQTGSGLPFFVMELVRGVSITEFCDREKLGARQRLELFIDVCNAIQHAHQKGVVHRDIKPSNILVSIHDSRPVVKVIDFGVAKAIDRQLTDHTVFTKISQIVGTPLYMSPEQADLSSVDIDTRSDIYSLGVLLYELLTGTTPFDKEQLKQAAFDEMRRIIREEEPQRPSTKVSSLGQHDSDIGVHRNTDLRTLTRSLRGDLDWIIMKALEKDRARRYETANGFAMDVRRYLNAEPVMAGPPSTLYKLRKFIDRNRAGVVAASLVAIALIAGLIGTGWGMAWALQEKGIAEQERTKAIEAKDAEHEARIKADELAITARNAEQQARRNATNAERRFQLAVRAIENYHTGVSKDLLLREPRFEDLRNNLLQSAIDFYRQLENELELSRDPVQKSVLSDALTRLAEILEMVGESQEAIAAYEKAISIHASLRQEDFYGDDLRFEYAHIASSYGYLLTESAASEKAIETFNEAIRIIESLGPVEELTADHLYTLTNAISGRAAAESNLGLAETAKESLAESIRISQSVVDLNPEDDLHLFRLGTSLGNLAVKHRTGGDIETALEYFEREIEVFRELVAMVPNNGNYQVRLAGALNSCGHTYKDLGRNDEGAANYLEAAEIAGEIVTGFPNNAEFASVYANILVSVAGVQTASGEQGEARRSLRRAIRLFEGLQGAENRWMKASAHRSLGILERREGAVTAAVEQYDSAMKIYEELYSETPDNLRVLQHYASSANNYAMFLADIGRSNESMKLYEDSIRIRRRIIASDNSLVSQRIWLAAAKCNLGSLYRKQGEFDTAIENLNDAFNELDHVQYNLPRTHPDFATGVLFRRNSHFGSALVYQDMGEYADAADHWHQAALLDTGQDIGFLLARELICRSELPDFDSDTAIDRLVSAGDFDANSLHQAALAVSEFESPSEILLKAAIELINRLCAEESDAEHLEMLEDTRALLEELVTSQESDSRR